MFLHLNFKQKINVTIMFLKFTLFALVILCAFLFTNTGIDFLIILGTVAIIGILLLHALSKMFDSLFNDYVKGTINNNTLLSSNILDAVLTQSEFTNNNENILTEISQGVDKLKIEAYSTKDIVQSVIEKSQKTVLATLNEETYAKESLEKMYIIKQKLQIVAELIIELSEQVQHITNNISTVEDIAEQTNMLALNAAVEAARAGEHGKGFAIVAGEIRKLADESKIATAKITNLIKDIQNTTNSTVLAAEDGSKELESGVNLTVKISDNIFELKNTVNQTTEEIHKILSALNTQFGEAEKISQSTQNVNKAIKDMNIVLKEKIKVVQDVVISTSKTKSEVIDK